jgi:hypothetical protein
VGFAGVPISSGQITLGHRLQFNGSIENYTVFANVTGSVLIDVKKGSYTNYPNLTSISSTNPIQINNNIKNEDYTLSSWTKTFSSGDIVQFCVTSGNGSINQLQISLGILKDL